MFGRESVAVRDECAGQRVAFCKKLHEAHHTFQVYQPQGHRQVAPRGHVKTGEPLDSMWYTKPDNGEGMEVLPWMKQYWEGRDRGSLTRFSLGRGWEAQAAKYCGSPLFNIWTGEDSTGVTSTVQFEALTWEGLQRTLAKEKGIAKKPLEAHGYPTKPTATTRHPADYTRYPPILPIQHVGTSRQRQDTVIDGAQRVDKLASLRNRFMVAATEEEYRKMMRRAVQERDAARQADLPDTGSDGVDEEELSTREKELVDMEEDVQEAQGEVDRKMEEVEELEDEVDQLRELLDRAKEDDEESDDLQKQLKAKLAALRAREDELNALEKALHERKQAALKAIRAKRLRELREKAAALSDKEDDLSRSEDEAESRMLKVKKVKQSAEEKAKALEQRKEAMARRGEMLLEKQKQLQEAEEGMEEEEDKEELRAQEKELEARERELRGMREALEEAEQDLQEMEYKASETRGRRAEMSEEQQEASERCKEGYQLLQKQRQIVEQLRRELGALREDTSVKEEREALRREQKARKAREEAKQCSLKKKELELQVLLEELHERTRREAEEAAEETSPLGKAREREMADLLQDEEEMKKSIQELEAKIKEVEAAHREQANKSKTLEVEKRALQKEGAALSDRFQRTVKSQDALDTQMRASLEKLQKELRGRQGALEQSKKAIERRLAQRERKLGEEQAKVDRLARENEQKEEDLLRLREKDEQHLELERDIERLATERKRSKARVEMETEALSHEVKGLASTLQSREELVEEQLQNEADELEREQRCLEEEEDKLKAKQEEVHSRKSTLAETRRRSTKKRGEEASKLVNEAEAVEQKKKFVSKKGEQLHSQIDDWKQRSAEELEALRKKRAEELAEEERRAMAIKGRMAETISTEAVEESKLETEQQKIEGIVTRHLLDICDGVDQLPPRTPKSLITPARASARTPARTPMRTPMSIPNSTPSPARDQPEIKGTRVDRLSLPAAVLSPQSTSTGDLEEEVELELPPPPTVRKSTARRSTRSRGVIDDASSSSSSMRISLRTPASGRKGSLLPESPETMATELAELPEVKVTCAVSLLPEAEDDIRSEAPTVTEADCAPPLRPTPRVLSRPRSKPIKAVEIDDTASEATTAVPLKSLQKATAHTVPLLEDDTASMATSAATTELGLPAAPLPEKKTRAGPSRVQQVSASRQKARKGKGAESAAKRQPSVKKGRLGALLEDEVEEKSPVSDTEGDGQALVTPAPQAKPRAQKRARSAKDVESSSSVAAATPQAQVGAEQEDEEAAALAPVKKGKLGRRLEDDGERVSAGLKRESFEDEGMDAGPPEKPQAPAKRRRRMPAAKVPDEGMTEDQEEPIVSLPVVREGKTAELLQASPSTQRDSGEGCLSLEDSQEGPYKTPVGQREANPKKEVPSSEPPKPMPCSQESQESQELFPGTVTPPPKEESEITGSATPPAGPPQLKRKSARKGTETEIEPKKQNSNDDEVFLAPPSPRVHRARFSCLKRPKVAAAPQQRMSVRFHNEVVLSRFSVGDSSSASGTTAPAKHPRDSCASDGRTSMGSASEGFLDSPPGSVASWLDTRSSIDSEAAWLLEESPDDIKGTVKKGRSSITALKDTEAKKGPSHTKSMAQVPQHPSLLCDAKNPFSTTTRDAVAREEATLECLAKFGALVDVPSVTKGCTLRVSDPNGSFTFDDLALQIEGACGMYFSTFKGGEKSIEVAAAHLQGQHTWRHAFRVFGRVKKGDRDRLVEPWKGLMLGDGTSVLLSQLPPGTAPIRNVRLKQTIEGIRVFLMLETVLAVQGLHSAGIVHGHLTETTVLVVDEEAGGPLPFKKKPRWGQQAWKHKGIRLAGLELSADRLQLGSEGTFVGPWPCTPQPPSANKEWCFEVDYHSVAHVLYKFFTGRELELEEDDGLLQPKGGFQFPDVGEEDCSYDDKPLIEQCFSLLLNSTSADTPLQTIVNVIDDDFLWRQNIHIGVAPKFTQ